MKFLELHARIIKNQENIRIQNENHENHENHVVFLEKQANNENHRIPRENYENN